MTQQRIITTASVDTQILVERMKKLEIGEVITYDDLSSLIGREITASENRSALQSARRILCNQHRISTGVIRKVGIKRLSGEETVFSIGTVVKAVYRKAAKGIRTIANTVEYDTLSRKGQVEYNLNMSQLGAIAGISNSPSREKIRAESGESQLPLAFTKTLALFTKSKK